MIKSSLVVSVCVLILLLLRDLESALATNDEGLFIGENLTFLAWIKTWAPVIRLTHAPHYMTGRCNISEGVYCDIVVRDPDVLQNNHWHNGGSFIENIIGFYRLHTTIKCAVSNLEFKCLVDIIFFLGL